MRGTPGKASRSDERYAESASDSTLSPGKRTRTEARYGAEGSLLPPEVLSRLEAAFGSLPAFDVVVDPGQVPDGARAASDARNVYLRDEADASDLGLVAHEVAHVVHIAGAPLLPGGSGHEVHADQATFPVEAREADDQTGSGRRSLEEEADKAAADVQAGNTVAAMSSTPVTEGEVYLQVQPGRVPARAVRLVLFPGEQKRADGTTEGHLYVYVNGEMKKAYKAVGGPAPGAGYADRGGHNAGVTPAGDYTLSAPEHHTTMNWPMSVIPWGAKLREDGGGEVEYSPDEGRTWKHATGIDGDVTRASIIFEEKTRASQARIDGTRPKPVTLEEKKLINESTRTVFYEGGTLLPAWNKNDFGNWAFNMTRSGARSAYYVHTTPDDEALTAGGGTPNLDQSHGCVHIRPADRAEMMALGYLQAGVKMTVKKYGLQGP